MERYKLPQQDLPDPAGGAELSMGWVDPWVGLGWFEIFQFLVGWVGSTTENVLKFERIMLMHLKHG